MDTYLPKRYLTYAMPVLDAQPPRPRPQGRVIAVIPNAIIDGDWEQPYLMSCLVAQKDACLTGWENVGMTGTPISG
jgi:hypothetical protein